MWGKNYATSPAARRVSWYKSSVVQHNPNIIVPVPCGCATLGVYYN
ncbi:MAG: hypothetical protein JNL72_05290 [Flavipsychrobacter sp.]|nr:hypothetical protein [Flavipsychrobacter sp.]